MSLHSKWIRNNLVFYENQRWYDAIGPTVVKRMSLGENVITDSLAGWVTTLVEAGASETTITGVDAQPGGVLNNLVFYENQRWYDAIGPTVVKRMSLGENVITDSLAGWVTTLVEAGASETTITGVDAQPGGVLITTDSNENDGANLQAAGRMFKLDGAYPLYFGIKFQASEATQSDFYVGLAVTTTDALGGVTDGVAFRKADGSTAVSLVIEKDSNETTGTVDTFAATTDVIYEFTWNGTYIDAYIDGVLQTRLAMTNLPNDEALSPVIQFLTGDAASETMSVEWVRCIQCR